jgi:hypothetical protein
MPDFDNRGLEFNSERPGAEFDLLLRSALDTYADPGPDSQLAQRILAGIAAEGESERTRWTIRMRRLSRWAVALPVAACLIVAIVLLGSKLLHNPADRTNQARVTLPMSTNASAGGSIAISPSVTARRSDVSRPRRHSSPAAIAASAEHLPKLDVFPAPQPLTPAEKALVAYVAHVPETERKSLVEAQKQSDAPLSIAALEIQPIEPPEPGGN